MKNEIIKIEAPEFAGLEKSKAETIKATFEPMAEMLQAFEDDYNAVLSESQKEITVEITAKARRLRLDIGKIRIETGKLKDKQKEYIKLEDKAIMGVHNILVWAVKEKEDKLKEIEDYFEIQEQKRLNALQIERVDLLSKYVADAQERSLSGMENDVWEAYLSTKKKEFEDRIAAEKKAEEERIAKEKAEIEERKRIAAENEKLKKEAIERERLAKIEADKIAEIEAKRIKEEQAAKKAQEEKERKEREAYEAKLKQEREAREKLEREAKEREQADKRAQEEKEAVLQAELNKGDAEKVEDLKKDLELLKTKYAFKSAKNKKMYSDVSILIDKVINHIG